MDHSPGFLQIVNEARSHITEITLKQARARMTSNPKTILIDVREDNEWSSQHVAGAIHIGKGILERDIEKLIPDTQAEIIMYCGGGFRSALTADVARRMGYKNVFSLVGGFKVIAESDWLLESGNR